MRKKLFIATTIPLSLSFFEGQPRIWKEKFDVCMLSSNEEELNGRAAMEGVRYKVIPMSREISLWRDCISLINFILFF